MAPKSGHVRSSARSSKRKVKQLVRRPVWEKAEDHADNQSACSSDPLDPNILGDLDLSPSDHAHRWREQQRYVQAIPDDDLGKLGGQQQPSGMVPWKEMEDAFSEYDQRAQQVPVDDDDDFYPNEMTESQLEEQVSEFFSEESIRRLPDEDWETPGLAVIEPPPKEFSWTDAGFRYSWRPGCSKPYTCEVEGCTKIDKTFEQLSKLKKHQKNHGERKQVCSQCGMRFVLAHYLKVHMASHSEKRPFKCLLCPLSFKRKDALDKHKRDTCGKSRRRRRRLTMSATSTSGSLKTPSTGEVARPGLFSKSAADITSSPLQRLASRMDNVEIVSNSSYPPPGTPSLRPYYL